MSSCGTRSPGEVEHRPEQSAAARDRDERAGRRTGRDVERDDHALIIAYDQRHERNKLVPTSPFPFEGGR